VVGAGALVGGGAELGAAGAADVHAASASATSGSPRARAGRGVENIGSRCCRTRAAGLPARRLRER
jgi:hypothetical protein